MTNCQLTRSVRSDLETAVSTVERGELALRGYCQNTVDAWPCLNPRNTTSHLVIYMFRWLLRVSEYVFSPCWWLGHHRCEAMPLEQNWFLTTIRSCNLQVADSELWQENASRNPFGCQPEGFDRQLSKMMYYCIFSPWVAMDLDKSRSTNARRHWSDASIYICIDRPT